MPKGKIKNLNKLYFKKIRMPYCFDLSNIKIDKCLKCGSNNINVEYKKTQVDWYDSSMPLKLKCYKCGLIAINCYKDEC